MKRLALVLGLFVAACAGKKECKCEVDTAKAGSAAAPVAPPEAKPAGATDLAKGAGDDIAKSMDQAPAPAPAATTGGDVTAEDVGKEGIPTTEIQGFAGVEETGFRVSYADTDVPLHQKFVEILKGIQLYEK